MQKQSLREPRACQTSGFFYFLHHALFSGRSVTRHNRFKGAILETLVASPLSKALSKAQGKFKTPTLNRTAKIKNAAGLLLYETHYADIQECISCIKDALAENELSFIQAIDFIHTPKEMWVLRLTLRHSSGELIDSVLPLNVTQTPQQLGGTLTYFKRYQLSAFFGLAADFDDDGNAAEGKGNVVDGKAKEAPKKAPPAKPPQNAAPGAPPRDNPPMTPLDILYATIDDYGLSNEQAKDAILKAVGKVIASKDLTAEQIDAVLKYLKLTKTSNPEG